MFNVLQDRVQLANGRWVADMTTFAYLVDGFVPPSYQSTGLGKWFVADVLMRAFDTEGIWLRRGVDLVLTLKTFQ